MALITAALAALSLAGTACGSSTESANPPRPPQAATGWQEPNYGGQGGGSPNTVGVPSVSQQDSEDAQDDREDAQDSEDAQDDREDDQDQGRALVIRDEGAKRTENCDGRKAIVTANNADITLNGTCPLVKITGQNTSVHVGSTSKAVVVGTGDTLRYASGQPFVVNPRGNDVAQGGRAAA